MTAHPDAQPVISVIMAAHNAAPFLADAIASVACQETISWELICVDDGSSDETAACLDRYARQDERIRIFRNEVCKGPAASRNRALRHARGSFVAILDADDRCVSDRFARSLRVLQRDPQVILVGSEARVVDASGVELEIGLPPGPAEVVLTEDMLLTRNRLTHSSILVRSEAMRAVGGYDEFFRYSMDYDLYLRLIANGRMIRVRPPLVFYRYSPDQITATRWCEQRAYAQTAQERARARMARGEEIRLEEAYREALQRVVRENRLSAGRTVAWPHYQVGSFYVRARRYQDARDAFWRAWRADPMWWQPLARWVFTVLCPGGSRLLTRWRRQRAEGE